MVHLFHGVHATVGLGQQSLDVETIFRAKRCSHAHANQIAAGNSTARFNR
jgi:hypothetical protein